jgi:hypothetical protein
LQVSRQDEILGSWKLEVVKSDIGSDGSLGTCGVVRKGGSRKTSASSSHKRWLGRPFVHNCAQAMRSETTLNPSNHALLEKKLTLS